MNALLQGRYEIIHTLSAGGFGETFLAVDRQLPSQRKVVIKKFKPQQQLDARTYEIVRERFEREAAVLEALSDVCRHVPKLYAFFSEAGDYFLVQEFIEGQTLTAFVRTQGRLDEARTRQLLTSLLTALHEIHAQGIIHRDIKPDNILLRAGTGQPVLIDFGAVKEIVTTVLDAYGTPQRASLIIGTPGYVPAEQSVGRPVYASDLYSLAMTMIFALTGREPRDLNDPASGELRWHQYVDKLSQPLMQLLDRAIQFHYRERFKNAQEMLIALDSTQTFQQPAPLQPTEIVDRTTILRVASLEVPLNALELGQSLNIKLNGDVKLELVPITGGSFDMGSNEFESEMPIHRVTVAPFYLGKFQVTQAQWLALMGNNPSHFKGEDLPVESVSWDEAVKFCRKLSKQTGYIFRLPSEAEWEYACRAGSTGRWSFGDDVLLIRQYAWYDEGIFGQTHPVGQKQPNTFGLHDMHGNVWEWCEDGWHNSYHGAPTDGSAWLSGEDSTQRMLRGGSWYSNKTDIRSASRNSYASSACVIYDGFRLALSAGIS